MSPYDVEETVSKLDAATGNRTFQVKRAGQAALQAVTVWYSEADGARCTQCQGRLVEMRSDCPHARVVARIIKKESDARSVALRDGGQMSAAELSPMHGNQILILDYTNYRGERSTRRVRPIRWEWSQSEFHPGGTHYFLRALDLDKQDIRMFLASDIHSMSEQAVDAPAMQGMGI